MAKLDPAYRRFREKVIRLKRRANWRKRLTIAAAVICVLSAAVLLVRDAADLAKGFKPAPGSLIVNINTATSAELQTIPGIGEARAAQIIAGRPYDEVDELIEIVGIGEGSIEGIRPFVTTEGETTKRQR